MVLAAGSCTMVLAAGLDSSISLWGCAILFTTVGGRSTLRALAIRLMK
jgi:hypothetical protein